MSRVSSMFAPSPPSADADTSNREGYPAFTRSIEERFIQTLLTNTLGQTYYSSARDLLAEAEAVHVEMILKDPAFAAKAIVYARNRGFMRTQPIFALAILAGSPGPHFEQAFAETIRTPTDLADFTTILKARRKGEGGRRVKRVAGNWLVEKMNEYWAIKYGSEKEGGYSIRDLLQVYHPKAGRRIPLFDYLMGRIDYSATQVDGKTVISSASEGADALPQVAAFEALKRAQTDESKIAAISRGRLPHEVVTPFASSPAIWEALVPNMPIFALLRNLATIERHGVMDKVRDHVVSLLSNAEAVKKSKILPFRFVEAEKHVSDSRVKDALRDAVELSFESVPDIGGRIAVLLDCSPSMKPPYRSDGMMLTAATFAVALLKKAKGNGRLVLFDDEAKDQAISMRDSLLTQAALAAAWHGPGGTNPSAALDVLINAHEKVDSLVVITDGEQNRGAPFVDRVAVYRREVNRNVKLFEIDVSPQLNAIAPPTDPLTFAVYGWSDQALSFISMASRGWGGVVEEIRRGASSAEA